MIHSQIGMEEILFNYQSSTEKTVYKEPLPQIDLGVKIIRGYYVRLKNGNVLRVDELGNVRINRKYIDCKRRDGSHYRKLCFEQTPTYISNIFLDGREVGEYFVYEDVSECHRTIIECIYKGDSIIDKKNRYLIVKSKVIRKNKIYLVCDYGNTEIRVDNMDIARKCMADKIEVYKLSVGDKVKCRHMGWVTVYKVWSKKIQVYGLSDDRLFFVNERDILEVADLL